MDDHTPSTISTELYQRDGLAWSERQVALLRQLVAGDRMNEAPDWTNIIEEIEAMGRSELRQCESLLIQALVHLLKLHAWPESLSVNHWRGEAVAFLSGAARAFTPSMRQRIDVNDLYADARHQVSARTDESGEPLRLPQTCPFAIDDLVARLPDIAALDAMLAGHGGGKP